MLGVHVRLPTVSVHISIPTVERRIIAYGNSDNPFHLYPLLFKPHKYTRVQFFRFAIYNVVIPMLYHNKRYLRSWAKLCIAKVPFTSTTVIIRHVMRSTVVYWWCLSVKDLYFWLVFNQYYWLHELGASIFSGCSYRYFYPKTLEVGWVAYKE